MKSIEVGDTIQAVASNRSLIDGKIGVVMMPVVLPSGRSAWRVDFSGMSHVLKEFEMVRTSFRKGDRVRYKPRGTEFYGTVKGAAVVSVGMDRTEVSWDDGEESTIFSKNLEHADPLVDPGLQPKPSAPEPVPEPTRNNAYIFDPARHDLSPAEKLGWQSPERAYELGVDAALSVGVGGFDPGTLVETLEEIEDLGVGTYLNVVHVDSGDRYFAELRTDGLWHTLDTSPVASAYLWTQTAHGRRLFIL